MKTFKEWIGEGDTIYGQALEEYQNLEKQLGDIESRLAEKKEEVNQIAAVIGKPPIAAKSDGNRVERLGQMPLIDREAPASGSIPASRHTIAKVLAGKSIG